LLMVIIAMVLALLLAALLLDIFSEISGQEFTLKDLLKGNFILSIIAVGLTAAIISGIYPALYLSSFNPVSVLKGKTLTGKGNGRLRQALVVVQFTLSIVIAISAVFIYMQMEYLRDKNLGFEKNDLIYIPMADDMKEKYYSLKDELQNETLILGVTACNQSPVRIFSNAGGADWEGKDPEKNVLVGTNTIDYDYLETMKMELVSGRDFSRDYTSDMARDTTGNFLINEEVARIMDIGDPVGKSFRFMGLNGKIIGVLKNFHFKGADQKIEPIAFALTDINYLNNILIRLTPGNIPSSLQTVERVWNEIIPEFPLEYSFIDQDYYDLYRSQMHLSDLLRYFTFLAVIIACMGLYGLSSYATERRTNEIGVRKVMGADVLAILGTFSKEFLILIIISIILAVPAGYIIVNNLLKQFPYRIETDMLVFIAIALGATLITIITISFHAYKATRINPAEALKIE
jgi:putative ABC transport system permease protein